jgi:DNA helicase-2/ATP-dependent DNA helicase PcrA
VLEDSMRRFSDLGAPARRGVDRAFDDLYRQFFVAFSRAQQVLLLVGLAPSLPGGRVPNVATGWRRNRQCPWSPDYPFLLI